MQILESRLEAHLKEWTRDEKSLKAQADDALREAELVALIAEFLKLEGMDDADDEEYRKYCDDMKKGARQIVDGIKQGSAELAGKGMTAVSQACSDCHENYR